ncbi:transposase family protein [Kitasatospora sp. NPDC058444]|uniref:transposase family protein n=1 Tax=Kitasatospora sp. NPDC058444 TaxID=3346504 RepID=UPI003669C390
MFSASESFSTRDAQDRPRHQRGRSLQETLPGTPAARGRTRLRPSSRAERAINRALSAARAPVERSIARLKSWQILRRARCSPNRMTFIAAAILTLERQCC